MDAAVIPPPPKRTEALRAFLRSLGMKDMGDQFIGGECPVCRAAGSLSVRLPSGDFKCSACPQEGVVNWRPSAAQPVGNGHSKPEAIEAGLAASDAAPTQPEAGAPAKPLDVALGLTAAGLPIFPVRIWFNTAKNKWEKKPHIEGWQNNATINPNQVRTWWREWPNAAVGIEMGRADLVLIDADRHAGGADGVAAFAELVAKHKELKPHPVCKTPGEGEHHYFKQAPGMKLSTSSGGLPQGIDVRGVGGFAVAPGSIRPDGKRWSSAGLAQAYKAGNIPIIPDWLALKICGPKERAKKDKAKSGSGQAKPNNKAQSTKWSAEEEGNVREALRLIPADDRKLWFRVGAALHSTGGSSAQQIWAEWSRSSAKFDLKEQDKTWESFHRGYNGEKITLATLFHIAKEHGWQPPGSAPSAGESTDVLAEMNEIHATVSVAGKFRVMTFGPDKEYSKQTVVTFSTKTDFLNHVVHPKVLVTEKDEDGATREVKKPRGQHWISHPGRRQFDDIDFLPGGPAVIEVRDRRLPGRVIRRHNMWSGFSIEPGEGDCGLYLAHLFDHVCREDQAAYDYLLGWMASGVQNPANPGRACISMRGEPGSGKGITAREYGKLFGRHFAPLNQREHVIGKFNHHTAESCLIFADEALFVGDMRDADILKYLVSEEDKLLERKGIDAIRTRNYARLIVASNHDHVLRIEVHDRRYCALHVVLPKDMVGSDGADNRRAYFGAIAHQMENRGRAALLHMLLNMDITDFNPERIPQTEELDKQKLLSASPGDQAVIALASDGHLPGALASRPYIAYSRTNQSHDGLYDFMRKAGGRGLERASDNELADILKNWGFTNKKLSDGNAWAAPDLSKLRTDLGRKYPALVWGDASWWGHSDD
jgi:hypothetical protein